MVALPRSAVRLGVAAAAITFAGYVTAVANAWRRYGHSRPSLTKKRDALLDQFMPEYDAVERHQIFVAAPAATVLAAAKEQDLMRSPLTRAIFKARELALGAAPDDRLRPRGLLAFTQSMGWGVLAERADREVVVGAVTRPWEADVVFRALPAERFAAYDDPGNVKIVWTLRAEPIGEHASLFLTETRAVATDADARRKFRRYWAFASPGIAAIRWLSLGPLKREAERRGPSGGNRRTSPARITNGSSSNAIATPSPSRVANAIL